jgi:hypothetical protein
VSTESGQAQVAYYAAKAAKVFQPSHSRAEALAALSLLERYYDLIQRRSHEPFDVRRAAAAELDWWQLRREHATPTAYGDVVAQVSEEVYGSRDRRLRESAQLRAAMMDYRDQRSDGRMRAEDWHTIEENLVKAYALLAEVIAMPPDRVPGRPGASP